MRLGNPEIVKYNLGRSLSGRGAVRLARLHGVQEVEGSNPFAPTHRKTADAAVFVFTKSLLV